MDAGLEGWKVISSWEDGKRKRVLVFRCHGINELANAFVRLVSNLSAYGCWVLENRVVRANETFGGIIILSRQNKSHGNI